MLPPICCFTCGKMLSKIFVEYQKEVIENMEKNLDTKKILDSLNLKRYCCRMAIITAVDNSSELPIV